MADSLIVRDAGEKGRGLFAARVFREGELIVELGGDLRTTEELTDDVMALQVGPDRWLCSAGEHLDDFANHSCEPNAGFRDPDRLALFALREIAVHDEITWDYSTSINEPEWELTCCCGSANCRQIIKPWYELGDGDRSRLRPIAMGWLRTI
jgi:SET domain-containing protein